MVKYDYLGIEVEDCYQGDESILQPLEDELNNPVAELVFTGFDVYVGELYPAGNQTREIEPQGITEGKLRIIVLAPNRAYARVCLVRPHNHDLEGLERYLSRNFFWC